MKVQKNGRFLSTVPVFIQWISDKIEAQHRKKRAKMDVDAIENLERLHRIKGRGAITEEDYQELKES